MNKRDQWEEILKVEIKAPLYYPLQGECRELARYRGAKVIPALETRSEPGGSSIGNRTSGYCLLER